MDNFPNMWCVKSDIENPLTDKLIDYANEHGAIPNYNKRSGNVYYHFPSFEDCTTSRNIREGYVELTLQQFVNLIDKKMKEQIEALPVIHGEYHHLLAFLQDCIKLGYEESKRLPLIKGCNYLKLNGNTDSGILTNASNFKIICSSERKNYYSSVETLKFEMFNLPQDWGRALDLMEFNMKVWKELNEERKIFNMISSSGDFELEVSKKGIYYKPEDSWLSTDFLWEFTNPSCTLPVNGKSGYTVQVTKVHVGCKKDTLVSQWKEVYDYYNSIKD